MRAIVPQAREAFGLGLGNCSADEVVGLRELGELCTCLNFDFDAPLFWENQHSTCRTLSDSRGKPPSKSVRLVTGRT
jgi:hypothetical protein